MVLNGDRLDELRAGESRNISHGHPGEVKEILKDLVTILLDCGDMSPFSKARTHPRTPKRRGILKCRVLLAGIQRLFE